MQPAIDQFLCACVSFGGRDHDFATLQCKQPRQSMISCSLVDTHRLAPAGLALMIALGLAACQQQASQPQSPPTMVQVETVTLTDYAPTVRLTGEVRAQVESD